MNSALDAAFKRHAAGDRTAALPYYEAGLRHEPENANAWTNMAELLSQAERHSEAITCAEKAVDLAPHDANAAKNLGMILCRAEAYTEAEVWLDRAAALTPGESWSLALDLALLYYKTGRLAQSEVAFVHAISWAPNDEIRSVLSTHMAYPVLSGAITKAAVGSPDWQRGLAFYRHRFNEVARTQAWDLAPEWEGEDLEGKHILVHQDQGDGDTIQFCRFLPELGRRAAKVTLAVPRQLIGLFYGLRGRGGRFQLDVLDFEGPLPIPDYHSPICTYFLHLDCTSPGKRVPYLHTAGARVMLDAGARPGDVSVGLVWAPRPTGEGARRRAIPIELLLPLARIPGVRLYSLQYGEAARDMARCGIIDLSTRLRDWADTAAYMERLDLIISIDSAPLHLAGAMNKRCIGLLPYSPCWRWGVGIEENCFYPTMTLLRQDKPGDWSGVMNRLRHVIVNMRSDTHGRKGGA